MKFLELQTNMKYVLKMEIYHQDVIREYGTYYIFIVL